METNIPSRCACKMCDKTYSTPQNLWKHTSKHHPNIISIISAKNPLSTAGDPLKSAINTVKSAKKSKKQYICEYCKFEFTRSDSLKKHYNICKLKKVKETQLMEENNMLKEQLKKQEEENKKKEEENRKQFEEISQIKSMLSDLINKNCKVHPKTLQKINKQLNGDNNNITEINNKGTINNTYNIIGLGHENLTEVFSKKEKMAILKYRYCSLPQLVEYAHFNDKYPQFKNILITNTQNTLAYKYDTKKKQFVAINKDELLEDIVDERMCDINSFYEELEGELDNKTKEILDKVKDKIENDPEYKELKKKDIKLIIYNNRKKVSKGISKDLEIEV